MRRGFRFDYIGVSMGTFIWWGIEYLSWNLVNKDIWIGIIVIFMFGNMFAIYRLCKHIDELEEELNHRK